MAPAAAFKSVCKIFEKLLAGLEPAEIYFVIPIPRYVRSACCDDAGHVTNRHETDYENELLGAGNRLSGAVAATDLEVTFINTMSFFGPVEVPLQDKCTADGFSIWADDGVHLTSSAATVAAAQLMAKLNSTDTDDGDEPLPKRQRLESVIPVRAQPPTAATSKTKPPVAAPAWLSGQLPPPVRGGGNNNKNRGKTVFRGTPAFRGRSSGRGGRRGGHQGRW